MNRLILSVWRNEDAAIRCPNARAGQDIGSEVRGNQAGMLGRKAVG